MCGNSTELTKVDSSRLPLNWGEDNLASRIPTGFMDDSLAPQGWIARTDPDGKEWELIAAGFRNPFDIAFNRDGELFTYDADMEWDIGEPWYRPTRVNHVISGAEFGFRNGSGKWPAYSIDSFGAVVDIGPGSPTGITFGYGAKFPKKYRDALFISDWSFGKLRAVHLRPDGASYTAEVEEFISGQPLPVTDVVINPPGRGDVSRRGRPRGAVGPLPRDLLRRRGRRVEPAGSPGPREQRASCGGSWRVTTGTPTGRGRRGLALPGRPGPGHPLRRPDRRGVAGPVALAAEGPERARPAQGHRGPGGAGTCQRQGPAPSQADRPVDPTRPCEAKILAALDAIDWSHLGRSDRVDLLRAYSLAFIRLGRPDDEACRRLVSKLDPLFPARAAEVDFLLAEILCYLQAPTAAPKVMAALREAPTQEEKIQYALVLRGLKAGWTPALREEYFRWFVTEAAAYRGGNTFANALRTIKTQAIETLSDDERQALKPILDARPEQKSPRELLAARKVVKEWTVAELVPIVERGIGGQHDLERGRQLYGCRGLRVLPPIRRGRRGRRARPDRGRGPVQCPRPARIDRRAEQGDQRPVRRRLHRHEGRPGRDRPRGQPLRRLVERDRGHVRPGPFHEREARRHRGDEAVERPP